MENNVIVLYCNVGDIFFECTLDNGFFLPEVIVTDTHVHSCFELHIVGKGEIVLNDAENNAAVKVNRDTAALISPGVYHSSHRLPEMADEEIRRYALRIRIEELQDSKSGVSLYHEFTKKIGIEDSSIRTLKIKETFSDIECLYEEMMNGLIKGRLLSEVYFKKCMTELVMSVCDCNSKCNDLYIAHNSAVINRRKEEIESFFNKYFGDAYLNVDMLAKYMKLSVRHVKRIMGEYYGATFKEMLIDVRLNKAKSLLVRSDMTIENIAMAVGYDSVNGFNAAFKKKYGITPGKYRTDKK